MIQNDKEPPADKETDTINDTEIDRRFHNCEFLEMDNTCGRPHSEYDQCECPFYDPRKCPEREKDEC